MNSNREFYVDFLGLEVVMERDDIVTFASPTNSTAQISVVRCDKSNVLRPNISIEVTALTRHMRGLESKSSRLFIR